MDFGIAMLLLTPVALPLVIGALVLWLARRRPVCPECGSAPWSQCARCYYERNR